MPMTGYQMTELRKAAGMTQAELAEQVGLSRKSVNEAEALKGGFVEKRTEVAVRALTLAAKARSTLIAEAEQFRLAGDEYEERRHRRAATLLTGNFATDERTIYNLALTTAGMEARLAAR